MLEKYFYYRKSCEIEIWDAEKLVDATSRMKLTARQDARFDRLSGMPPQHGTDSLVARNIHEDKSIAFSWKSKCYLLVVALRDEMTLPQN